MAHMRLILASALTVANSLALAASDLDVGQLPAEQAQGSVRYRTGGIGEDEAVAMRRAQSAYPLSVEFVQQAKPRDEFLANVQVTIKDQAGNPILNATSEGPILLAELPAGIYTIIADAEGGTKSKRVQIAPHKKQHVAFVWPPRPGE